MKEAMLYTKETEDHVRCNICRHGCTIAHGKRGICNVRENRDGVLYSILYGKPCSIAIDPIEKKPLFHFHPSSHSLSIATYGCNFKCTFCQNWELSQYDGSVLSDEVIPPEKIVEIAVEKKVRSISYTYTEPTIFFEYAYDISRLAQRHNIENVFVTNGYMTRDAIDIIKPYLNAANVDLKGFRKDAYRKYMGAELDGVLDSIKYLREVGVWIEVTTLIVPGINDDERELRDIAKFLAETGRDIPWHISRFTPQYKETKRRMTPAKIMEHAYEIGREEGLRYVYLGNCAGDKAENTFCYKCGESLISREGFKVLENKIDRGSCPSCKTKIDGVF